MHLADAIKRLKYRLSLHNLSTGERKTKEGVVHH